MSTSLPPAAPPPAEPAPQWAPPPPQWTPPQESSKAVLALVLSILSWVTCGIVLSIPSLILAKLEINAIKAGRRALDKLTLAQVAFWISVGNIAVTVLMIPLIAALLVPAILGQAERARLTRARSDAVNLTKAAARLRTDTDTKSPACLTNLQNLVAEKAPAACGKLLKSCDETTPGALCWGGPYLTGIVPDPWMHQYTLEVEPDTLAITARSAGPDGVANTADDVSYMQ